MHYAGRRRQMKYIQNCLGEHVRPPPLKKKQKQKKKKKKKQVFPDGL